MRGFSKKTYIEIAILLFLIGTLAGCGSQKENAPVSETGNAEEAAVTDTAAEDAATAAPEEAEKLVGSSPGDLHQTPGDAGF